MRWGTKLALVDIFDRIVRHQMQFRAADDYADRLPLQFNPDRKVDGDAHLFHEPIGLVRQLLVRFCLTSHVRLFCCLVVHTIEYLLVDLYIHATERCW